jgi:hypothetical protein
MPEVNEYASWSIALRSMIQYKEKFNDMVIGKTSLNEDLTLGGWCRLDNNHFVQEHTIKGDFKKNFKNVDLGGGDQSKILENNSDTNSETTKTYKNKIGLLTTGGDNETRVGNLQKLTQKIFKKDTTGENNPINALLIDMETKLTAASYYDKASQLLEDKNVKKICLIPIGSTDLHVIIYTKHDDNKTISVTLNNLPNHSNRSENIDLGYINENTLFVFAGSSRYYLHEIYDTFIATTVCQDGNLKELPQSKTKGAEELITRYNLTDVKQKIKLKDLISFAKKAKNERSGNKKLEDFINCMKKINLNTDTDIKVNIMAGKGEDNVGSVSENALERCLYLNVNGNNGNNGTQIAGKRSRRNRKGKRSTKKARKQRNKRRSNNNKKSSITRKSRR